MLVYVRGFGLQLFCQLLIRSTLRGVRLQGLLDLRLDSVRDIPESVAIRTFKRPVHKLRDNARDNNKYKLQRAGVSQRIYCILIDEG